MQTEKVPLNVETNQTKTRSSVHDGTVPLLIGNARTTGVLKLNMFVMEEITARITVSLLHNLLIFRGF